jgi:probable phosphoglycerate mutase
MRALEAAFLIGVEGVTEVWLVRHADCYEDLTEAVDPPLSALGRGQAARLGERVRRAGVAAVYSSPWRRAVETARALSDGVRVDHRLVEMALEVGDTGFEFKEDPSSVATRVRAVVDEIVGRHPGQRAVVVTHGAAIVAFLTSVLSLAPGELRVLPYYSSVSVVRALGDRMRLASLGDTAHLE